ncbi:Craniofacial development protein 2 [Biomphalaria glabrata]|nr:Craniofacial development protein 2 [Biomphalaria glabrata]
MTVLRLLTPTPDLKAERNSNKCLCLMSNKDNIKENFYKDRNSAIIKTLKTNKLIILGYFNARLPHRKKTSWIHPRSKLWHHQVDFIIVRQSDRQDVKVTKALCGADCWTDHRLILSKLKICIKPPRRPQECKHAKRLDVGKLKIPNIKQGLINKLNSEIKTLHMNKDVKNSWNKLRDSVYSLVSSVLGQPKRKQQDWFDKNNVQIEQLLTHKQYCFKVFLCSPTCRQSRESYTNAKGEVQRNLRLMKESWLNKKSRRNPVLC